jgi:hypothetical protein
MEHGFSVFAFARTLWKNGAFHGHVRKEMSIMNEQNHIGRFKHYLAA